MFRCFVYFGMEIQTPQPQEVSDLDIAFPASVSHLMPKYEDIPKEFQGFRPNSTWGGLFNNWFYRGLSNLSLQPKPGIDIVKALRHIRCIMRSFEPKHEHKESAVAYLLSCWFEPPPASSWEVRGEEQNEVTS